MPMTFQYWRVDQALHNNLPGIPIVTANTDGAYDHTGTIFAYPVNFGTYTRDCLNYMWSTNDATIRGFLRYLALHWAHGGIIYTGTGGNSASANGGQPSMNMVAWELYGGNPGVSCQAAALMLPRQGRWQMLADRINQQPPLDIATRPGVGVGWGSALQRTRDRLTGYLFGEEGSGYFSDQTYLGPFGTGTAGLNLTAAEAQTWITAGTIPGRIQGRARIQLKLATVAALWDRSQNGAGCGSTVRFCHDNRNDLNLVRPPAIGLAHELIHAYYSLRGKQPGSEIPGDDSCVLFEWRCVGLGPWDEEGVCENLLRRRWSAAIAANPGMDAQNRKVPGKRVQY